MNKKEIRYFVQSCVERGRVPNGTNLPIKIIVGIEEAMVNCCDATASRKIRKILLKHLESNEDSKSVL
jgi:hypothetical protein